MLQRKPSEPREVMAKIVRYYDELAQQFKGDSRAQKKWFVKNYKPSAILHDQAKTEFYRGPEEIMKFWQDLKASGVTSISFKFDDNALPKVFQVDMKAKLIPPKKKKHDYIEIAVLSVFLELHREHQSADPEIDIVWGHWDVCDWHPIGEEIGR